MPSLPENYRRQFDAIVAEAEHVEGWITRRELELLVMLAACPTAAGELLEIGSYLGRSTIALAKAARLAGEERIVAVDPQLQRGVRAKFDANLEQAGVQANVEFHETMSWELGQSWNRPLRALWIDGCHQYASVKRDLATFLPHLADGAVVAMHDVLNHFDGSIRVFLEDVLLSDHFGAVGVCGSIGWAQYHCDKSVGATNRRAKLRLYRALSPLVPIVAFDHKPRGLEALKYRLLRSRIRRGVENPEHWVRRVA